MPGDVVHERDWYCTVDQDVIDRVIDKVFTYRVISTGLLRDQNLGADPIGTHHQDRIADANRDPHHATERPYCANGKRSPGTRHQLRDPVLGFVSLPEIDSCGGVS
jgi:hypothetical protein